MTRILTGVIAALILALGVTLAYAIHFRNNAGENALAYSNEVAAHDTTKVVSNAALRAVKRIYGDSMRAVERRAIQAEIERDALDKASNRNTTTRVTGTATVGTITGTTTGTTHTRPPGSLTGGPTVSTLDTTTRVATFNLYRAPFKLDATAKIPYAGSSTLDYTIALDTARFSLRVGCNREAERGINAAVATLVSSEWLRFRLDRVEQDDDVCARNIATDRKRARRWGVGGTLGYGVVYGRVPGSDDRELVKGLGGTLGLTFRF